MIAHVDVLLCRWGRWSVKQASRDVGYPSTSPMFKDATPGRGFGSEIPHGVGMGAMDMHAVDRAVQQLPIIPRCVVVRHYQHEGCSYRATAAACGVSHKSVTQYLNQAHLMISDLLENSA